MLYFKWNGMPVSQSKDSYRRYLCSHFTIKRLNIVDLILFESGESK